MEKPHQVHVLISKNYKALGTSGISFNDKELHTAYSGNLSRKGFALQQSMLLGYLGCQFQPNYSVEGAHAHAHTLAWAALCF